jgi:hypothetical protein
MVFWGEMCVFFYSENHLKLEMKKNSVTGWRNLFALKKNLVLQLVAG